MIKKCLENISDYLLEEFFIKVNQTTGVLSKFAEISRFFPATISQ